MKKLVSLFVCILFLIACSSDDDKGGGGVISQEYINVESEVSIGAQETTKTFTIDANCRWSLTLSNVWEGLNVAPMEGDSKGTVTITTPVNRSISDRTAKVTVSSRGSIKKDIIVKQLAGDVTLALSEKEHTFEAVGGKWAFTITSNTAWTITGAADGFSFDKTSGTGNASVEVTATENTSESSRSLVLTITAGTEKAEVMITQNSKTVISVTPKNIIVESTGGNHQIEVQSNADWILISDKNWVVASASTGTIGKTELTLTCAANPDPTPRNATITITSGNEKSEVAITQKATTILSVTPTRINAEASGGTFQIEVQSNADWTLSSNQNWLTASSANGTGNAQLTLSCAANPNPTSRSAVVTITAGNEKAEVTLSQKAATVLSVTPTRIYAEAAGGKFSLEVQSNEDWTLISNQNWVTASAANGTGNAQLSLTCAANPNPTSRTAVVTITAGNEKAEVTITQKATTVLSVTPTRINAEAAGGNFSLNVQCNEDWTLTSNQNWVTSSAANGTGYAQLTLTCAANTNPTTRSAVLTGHLHNRV